MRFMRKGRLLRLLHNNFGYLWKAAICMFALSVATFAYYRSLIGEHLTHTTPPEVVHGFAEGVGKPHIHRTHAQTVGHNCSITPIGETAAEDGDVLCRPWTITNYSCEATKHLFRKTNASCNHQERRDICIITSKSPTRHRVRCHSSACVTGTLKLGMIHPSSGILRWLPMVSSRDLEKQLSRVIGSTFAGKHFGFVFINCAYKQEAAKHGELRNDTMVQQLLLLPQKLYDIRPSEDNGSSPLNINIVVLDSVSRHHFYRSLPKSVAALREANKPLGGASVLDFQLVQSLKAKTQETMRTLWSGVYDGGLARVGDIFNRFKPIGYRSLWLQDTCWLGNWDLLQTFGIDTDLPSSARWHNFTATLAASGIDGFDVSLASCEMLRLLGVHDQFHGPHALCCNGRHMHDYIFDYLSSFQMSLKSARLPFITYLVTNVAHEATGRRVQTLDDRLAAYLRHLATSQENTLTLLLSDHGNSYGDYPERHFAGRLEMFNPLLFIMLPPDVAIRLGKQRMAVLKANQNRLVGMRDVYLFIRSVASLITQPDTDLGSQAGLLTEISVGRNCQDLFVKRSPDYCICTNATSPASSDDWHALAAEFAVGQLNNVIADSQKSGTVSLCERLQITRFENVTNRHQGNSVITTLDLHVPSFVPGRTAEVFIVTVSYTVTVADVGKTSKMKLLHYTRITSYKPYAVCASANVDAKICICDIRAQRLATLGDHELNYRAALVKSSNRGNASAILFGSKQLIAWKTGLYTIDKNGDRCLHVQYRKYTVGASFDVRNDCSKKRFKIRFSLKGYNVDSSARMPMIFVINPKHIRFVTVVRQTVKHLDWRWSYSIDYVELS